MIAPANAEGYSSIFAAVADMEQEAASFADACKVVILRNMTVEGIDTLIKRHLYPQRIRPVIAFGGYGTMAQDVLAPDGLVARTDPDVIVLALALDEIDPSYGGPGWTSDHARQQIEDLFDVLASKTRATIAVHDFIEPLWPEQGLLVNADGTDLACQIAALNRFVIETVRTHAPRFVLMDWERYLRWLGAEASIDTRGHYLWRSPFKRGFLDAWAQQLARVVCALRGRAKKVLVLDCDNTLWGGVVGEDGVNGIQLDPHHYPGRAFFDFQTTVLHLAERGVLVTLCSKNNETDVLEVLDRHPACRIRRSHLAAWRINWKDKASNIAELADELNLTLDSFVFVDDNPVECSLMQQVQPQVTVLQVPGKLHELPPLLLRDGLFDTLRCTDEDRQRARLYQSESQRKSARSTFASLDEYLQGLQTVAAIHRAHPAELPRIAQLTQKTNQFNLTTRRYSEEEIRVLAADASCAVYSLSARDRFDSLGLVGVLILRIADTVAVVDTLLVSCRALGRRLEDALVAYCLAELPATHPIVRWEAEYIPTAKNAQAADFWPRMGFTVKSAASDRQRYERLVSAPFCGTPTFVGIEAS